MQKLESRLGRGDSVQLGQIVEKVFHITLSSGWHRLKVHYVYYTKLNHLFYKTSCHCFEDKLFENEKSELKLNCFESPGDFEIPLFVHNGVSLQLI